MSWQLQEAKQRFSELVRRAEREGPQVVTRHGEEVVVVVPADEYRRMKEREGDRKMDFKEFLMSAPEGRGWSTLSWSVRPTITPGRSTLRASLETVELELRSGHERGFRGAQGSADGRWRCALVLGG